MKRVIADQIVAILRDTQDTDGEFYAPTESQSARLRTLLAEYESGLREVMEG